MHELPKTQFVSLPDALCLVVSTMHKLRQPTRVDSIFDMLRRQYIGMSIPKKDIIHCALESLTAEGRLCKTGDTYFMTPTWGSNPFLVNPAAMFMSYPANGPPPFAAPPFVNPSPYNHPWWANSLPRPGGKEAEGKPALCSTECQTGASIVNGLPPYRAKQQQRPQVTVTHAPAAVADSRQGKDKRSFIEKIFRRRSKSKPRDEPCSKENLKAPVRSTSADSKLSSAQTDSKEPNVDCGAPKNEHVAFSAQFPPPEWIYRPTIGNTTARNRLSMGPKDFRPSDDDDVFARGIWVDMEPSHPVEMKHRRRTGDLWFASQRAPMPILEENHGSSGSREFVKRARHKQRLSKYLSSSSECLNSVIFHADDSNVSPKKRNYHARKHAQAPHSKQVNFHRLPTRSSSPPSESVKYPGEKVSKSFEISPPRLMTSTPTPHATASMEARHTDSTQNDSALSTSPVDSGQMEVASRRKYSSWSSVDENMAYPSPYSSDPMGGEAPAESLDFSRNHTYENVALKQDHTYENLGKTKLDSTRFENITNLPPPASENGDTLFDGDDQKNSRYVGPRISRTCVSAL